MQRPAAPLTLVIDLAMTPAEHLIYEGILSHIPVGILQPGQSFEVETPLCFLALGRYDLHGEARHVDTLRRAGAGQLRAVVRIS